MAFSIEQCLKEENNRFRLVLAAAKRARQLENGQHSLLAEKLHDKSTVTALREIADGHLRIHDLLRRSEQE